jgi:hypothetical protein
MSDIKRTEETFLCTRAEALALVPRSARERAGWALSVRLDSQIADKPASHFQDGCASWLELSRKQATALLKDLLTDTMEARGARIKVRRTKTDDYPAKYWITQ